MKKLQEYSKKRNFNKTSEPKPQKTQKNNKKPLIFVVQWHNASHLHFDLRLQWKGVLLSWAVPKGFSFNPKDKRLAVKVEDHPVDYANFEGVIPKGEYGGGEVMLWDEGWFLPLEDFDEGLKKGSLKFEVFGQRIKGKWTLVRMQKEGEKQDNWLLIKEKDEFAKKSSSISNFKRSIKTNRTFDEIRHEKIKAKSNPFDSASVMLATLKDQVPTGNDWAFEIKYDGYRALAFIQKGKAKLVSRNDKDMSQKFEPIKSGLENFFLQRAVVLDGEIIVLDEQGKSDFEALQSYITKPSCKNLVYMVFDLLALDGKDLRKKPLLERKELLEKLLQNAPENFMFSDHILGKGEECFKQACKLKLEGVMCKKINSQYIGKRSEDWVKVKCYLRQEFVIGGFTLSQKKTEGLSSLLLGVMQDSSLVYMGRTGTGFDEQTAQRLSKMFKKIMIKRSPFANAVPLKKGEQIFFLKPKYVCEVQFAQITDDNQLRQASFKGLREDKMAQEVILEGKDKILGVKISSPERIVFKDKKISKLQVAQYYLQVADRMMPYLHGRVLSVVRCNEGVLGECFFKKHQPATDPGVKNIAIKNSEGKQDDYFYITSKSGIISEVQLGTVEFHTWGSKVSNLDQPDIMVFDLDPDKGMRLEKIREGVKDLKKVLQSLSLKCFLKTSGGKGYHVLVPFSKCKDWQKFHDFAKSVADLMESKWPQKYTSNVRKDARKAKIFIDWIRNGKGATSVAPYSLRARKGAKVSMPIAWSELEKVAPDGVDMFQALERLKKPDPWKDFFKVKQQLK